jgi:hypothetical protein
MTKGTQLLLPQGFEDLEPFVAHWALAEEAQRMHARWSGNMEDMTSFYNAMVPRIDSILDYLDTFGTAELLPAEERLQRLAFSLVEVANAVEVFSKPAPFNALSPERFVPVDTL